MNWKNILLRLAGLIAIGIAGQFLYAILVNVMIYLQMMPDELNGQGFGYALTQKAALVSMGTIPIGIAALFIREKWGLVLYFAPLYAPSVFAVIYTILQNGNA